jgi:hypothetical protein
MVKIEPLSLEEVLGTAEGFRAWGLQFYYMNDFVD